MHDQAFTVDDLIACYERGVFPMADSRHDEDIFLVDPEKRGIFPLDQFHIPRRLARSVRAEPYQVRIDTAFDAVVRGTMLSVYPLLMYRAWGNAVVVSQWYFGIGVVSLLTALSVPALTRRMPRREPNWSNSLTRPAICATSPPRRRQTGRKNGAGSILIGRRRWLLGFAAPTQPSKPRLTKPVSWQLVIRLILQA